MKPCIVIYNRAIERYEAYNEDGLKVFVSYWSTTGDLRETQHQVSKRGYSDVPLNSRCGRTIFDKLPLHVQMGARFH